MSSLAGSDNVNLNFSNRYIHITVGSHNNHQPILGSSPFEFITDWDGVFEIMVIDLDTNLPIADVGQFNLILNLDVEPVDSRNNIENNTLSQHMFVNMPMRTFEK
jgi:hypothetical protein